MSPLPLRRVIAACLAAAVIGAGCSTGRSDESAPMRFTILEGRASLEREGKTSRLKGESSIKKDDVLVLQRAAVGRLTLAPGRAFELVGAEVRVEGSSGLSLKRGSLLAVASAPVRVAVDGFDVASGSGTFRIDRALSVRTAVYQGGLRIEGAREKLTVSKYRQAVVAGSTIPQSQKPLRIDPSDRWDRRFLQEAIDLDSRLANFGRGLEAQLGATAGPGLYARVLPEGADLGFLAPYQSDRRSDLLIGLTIAGASGIAQLDLGTRFGQIFNLWKAGASWGLIALEFGVGQPALFDRLLAAVNRAGLFTAGLGPALTGRAAGSAGTTSASAGTGGDGGSSRSSPGPSRSPSPGSSPSPSPSPSPTSGPLDPVVDPVQEVVDDLIGQVPTVPLP